MNPEQWLSLKWNGGSTMSDRWLNQSKIIQTERIKIKERQRQGIDAAKERGVAFGRPEREVPENFYPLVKLWTKKKVTIREAAELCNMPRSTFYAKARKIMEAC